MERRMSVMLRLLWCGILMSCSSVALCQEAYAANVTVFSTVDEFKPDRSLPFLHVFVDVKRRGEHTSILCLLALNDPEQRKDPKADPRFTGIRINGHDLPGSSLRNIEFDVDSAPPPIIQLDFLEHGTPRHCSIPVLVKLADIPPVVRRSDQASFWTQLQKDLPSVQTRSVNFQDTVAQGRLMLEEPVKILATGLMWPGGSERQLPLGAMECLVVTDTRDIYAMEVPWVYFAQSAVNVQMINVVE